MEPRERDRAWMRRRWPWPLGRGDGHAALGVALTTLLLAACVGGGSSSIRSTQVSRATATATIPPSGMRTTLPGGPLPVGQPQTVAGYAWIQPQNGGKPQVWASIGGQPGRMVAQASGDDCATAQLGAPVLSPDGRHIVVAGGAGCGDGQSHGPVFVVDVATGVMSQIGGSNVLTNERSVGWFDSSTLYFADEAVYIYHLGASSVIAVPGTSGAVAATVRGSQLFYVAMEADFSMGHVRASLHRYSLTSQREAMVADLGSFSLPTGQSPPDFHSQGWDVSADGTRVVYQVTVAGPVHATPVGISASAIYYANADNSGRSQILRYMKTDNTVRLRLSPDGRQVAVTEATPAPDILSGCVDSPGASAADPCFHSYPLLPGLVSFGYAIWARDGVSFLAAANGEVVGGGLYRFSIGGRTGTLVQPGAYNPWGP